MVADNFMVHDKIASIVHHIEKDLLIPGNILYADGGTLHTYTAGSSKSQLVTGSSKSGYAEGPLKQALFTSITGFLQWNSTCVFVADLENHCIRVVDRQKNVTRTLIGNCTNSFPVDIGLNKPHSIVKNIWKDHSLFISDCFNHVIKEYDLITYQVTNWLETGMNYPTGMTFSSCGNMMVATHFELKRVTKQKMVEVIAGKASDEVKTGPIEQSSFDYLYELLFLSELVLIVTECGNNGTGKVRVVDKRLNFTYDLAEKNQFHLLAKFDMPRSLMIDGNRLYIGQMKAIFGVTCMFQI